MHNNIDINLRFHGDTSNLSSSLSNLQSTLSSIANVKLNFSGGNLATAV